MSTIIGTFYFKQTKSGNLIGEFTNNNMLGISTESADIYTSIKDKFVGDYKTTWFEVEKSQYLTLKIRIKESTNNTVIELTWENKSGLEKFHGLGFIVGKKLVGYYTDKQKT